MKKKTSTGYILINEKYVDNLLEIINLFPDYYGQNIQYGRISNFYYVLLLPEKINTPNVYSIVNTDQSTCFIEGSFYDFNVCKSNKKTLSNDFIEHINIYAAFSKITKYLVLFIIFIYLIKLI